MALRQTDIWTNALNLAADRLEQKRSPWWNDPVGWAREYIAFEPGEELTDYQEEALGAVAERDFVSVRGPRGLGKTTFVAIAVLWYAVTRDGLDWKIGATASQWHQLTAFLWPEVHKWARKLNWAKLGRKPFTKQELQKRALVLATGEAVLKNSNEPTALEGMHADHVLYVLDEAKAIPAAIFDSLEGTFSGAGINGREAKVLVVSTPGAPNGRFFDIHARRPGFEDWWVRHVKPEEAIAAGRITDEWVEKMKRLWGEGSVLYKHHVLGEFAQDQTDGVIPLDWVEQAIARWHEWHDNHLDPGPLVRLGVDVGLSQDKTIMAVRHRQVVSELKVFGPQDTMTTAGEVASLLRLYRSGEAVIDVIGIGAGVYDRLRELDDIHVRPFNAAARTPQEDQTGQYGFVNLRAAAWWTMRELLNPDNDFNIALPEIDELTGDLTAPRYKVTSGGKIQVESKEDIRKRIGRSTDYGDSVVMAFAMIPEEPQTGFVVYDAPVNISPF